ncbi:hypothetical protein ACMHYB_28800 [Sorangium sp. So ce1128]
MNPSDMTRSLREITRALFTGSAPIDPYSEPALLVRFAAALYAVQSYYDKEHTSLREPLRISLSSLLDDSEDDGSGADGEEQRRYLREVLAELSRAESDIVEVEREAWKHEVLSTETLAVPGMLYPDTVRYYKWLARTYGGEGEIVELGCWLGLSTSCLAEGLAENPRAQGKRIRVVDSFRWQSWMEPLSTDFPRLAKTFQEGDSFLELFWSFCDRHRAAIDVTSCRITPEDVAGLPALLSLGSGHIGALVIDLSDEYALHGAVWEALRPHLRRDRSVVVFNQFGNARAEGIRAFCRDHASELVPLHKPTGAAKGFLYAGRAPGT